MNRKKREGSLMIESLVAMSIALVSLLGIFALLTQSINLNKSNSSKFIATYLASEGIEVARSIVDANYTASTYPSSTAWNEGITDGSYELSYGSTDLGTNLGVGNLSATPLSYDSASGLYSYGSGSTVPFKRTVQITNISADEIKVVAVVQWVEKEVLQTVSLEDHFFNWRP